MPVKTTVERNIEHLNYGSSPNLASCVVGVNFQAVENRRLPYVFWFCDLAFISLHILDILNPLFMLGNLHGVILV